MIICQLIVAKNLESKVNGGSRAAHAIHWQSIPEIVSNWVTRCCPRLPSNIPPRSTVYSSPPKCTAPQLSWSSALRCCWFPTQGLEKRRSGWKIRRQLKSCRGKIGNHRFQPGCWPHLAKCALYCHLGPKVCLDTTKEMTRRPTAEQSSTYLVFINTNVYTIHGASADIGK